MIRRRVPPAVAKRAQVRRAAALVGVELDRHFADIEAGAIGVDDHLGRELHPRRSRVDPREGVRGEAAHAAMKIADRRAVEPTRNRGKHRIAEIAMQRRHGAGLDPAGKAIAHDQVGALLQPVDDAVDFAPVIGIVGIGHDQVLAASGQHGRRDRRAVTRNGLMDDARAEALGDLDRTVGRTVVADDHFADNPSPRERRLGLADADLE